jgi:soluble lytic murein transglycosylase-like protein
MRSRRHTAFFALALAAAWLAFGAAASAQNAPATAPGDPVTRAMERAEAALGASSRTADHVIEASRHVSAGAEARKRGDLAAADAALAEAERVAAALGPEGSSALAGDLARAIAAEREALSPRPALDAYLPAPSRPLPRALYARLAAARMALGPILVEERVPLELLSVAYVESGFNPMALSPKGARGIWQFMPATARRYGLAVEGEVDHRTHPEHATRAAARYLRDLYGQFGDWKLALAAYNAGEGRVWGVIRRTGIRDFDEMSRRGLLPAETRAYVPSVLAIWSRLAAPPAAGPKK